MRNRIIKIVVLASLGTSLISVAPSVMAAKKKIVWWVPIESSWKMVEERYEKQNPNVDVQIVHGDMDKFYTMVTAGLMPDVWGPWSTPGIRADVNRNWALDLGPYIKRDSKELKIDDFFPGVMRQFKVGGKQFSLPMFSFADYYFYNKQLFAQAGLQAPTLNAKDKSWNWEQMLTIAQKTSIKDATGRLRQYGINFSVGTFDFPNYFHMWDAEPYSTETVKTSVPQAVHWDTSEMANCLTRMWELKWKHNVVGGDINNGKTASTIERGWYTIQTLMKNKKVKWAIAPLPWAKTNSGTLWPDGWRVSRLSKNKDLAWDFVKFISSPETMRMVVGDPKSSKFGSPSVRKSVFQDTLGRDIAKATGMEPDDVFKVHEQADDAGIVKYQETVCLHADLVQYVDPELERLWANSVNPKTAAANIQKNVNKALPVLFKRWMNNIKFTGADKNYK